MPKDILIFKRIEKKYPTDIETAEKLLNTLGGLLKEDRYCHSTVCSTYLDTPDRLLIRNSIDAKVYKEKLRIRHYGQLTDDSRLFFEIKKKYKGVVYKRRVSLWREEVFDYIESGVPPIDTQIMREIDYLMKLYRQPRPDVCILCEREAYLTAEDPNVRLTFDENLRYRRGFPDENNISEGTPITEENEYILEIKTPGAMPLWLANTLSELKIYPQSFSKYAHAYYDIINKNKEIRS